MQPCRATRRRRRLRLMQTRLVLGTLVAALVASCTTSVPYTPVTPPLGSSTIPIKLLGGQGPLSIYAPSLFAATSIAGVSALYDGAHPRCTPAVCDFSHWSRFADTTGDVFLALSVTPGTSIASIVAWRGTAGTVMVNFSGPKTCTGADCTAPIGPMALAAVAESQLPTSVVTFQLSDGSGRARVDLRTPVASATAADVTADIQSAFKAAVSFSDSRLNPPD